MENLIILLWNFMIFSYLHRENNLRVLQYYSHLFPSLSNPGQYVIRGDREMEVPLKVPAFNLHFLTPNWSYLDVWPLHFTY